MRRGARATGRAALVAVTTAVFMSGVLTDVARADVDGARVRRGDVSIIHRGNRTIIRASDGSIIDYRSFNIGQGELVRFIQPGELARVLNRITGDTPTVIEGALRSNGQVYLVNPAGITFTRGSTVNVGGLHAAAGTMTNGAFLRGISRFTNLEGEVFNAGTIHAGQVHLAGQRVVNEGSIASPRGIVTMVAGDEVLIRQHGERITVRVDGKTLTDQAQPHDGETRPDDRGTPGVANSGAVDARRGQVVLGAGDLYALGIHNTGSLRAAGGRVTVAASDGAIVNDGVMSASVEAGRAGRVTVQAPSIANKGEISADADRGMAGFVEVTSRNHTLLHEGSRISAAGGAGTAHGGEVLIHSYDGLTVHGTGAMVDVSGGAAGGRGGFAEISGQLLIFNGDVDLGSVEPGGLGTLLLDPFDIRISNTGTRDEFLSDGFIAWDEGGRFRNIRISAAAIEAVVGDIVIEAFNDIYVNFPVNLVHGNNIRLDAQNNLFYNRRITGANNVEFVARQGSMFIDNGLTASGHLTLLVPEGDLHVSGELASGGDLWLRAIDGSLTVLSPASAGGFVRLESPEVRLGADLSAGTFISFPHASTTPRLNLSSDVTLDAPGTHLSGFVDGPFALRVTGDVSFGSNVGQVTPLQSLTVLGGTSIDGRVIRASEMLRFDGPVTFRNGTLFHGPRVIFKELVDSSVRPQHVSIDGDVIFIGPVGSQVPFKSLRVTGSTSMRGLLVRTTGRQHYEGPVQVGGPGVFEGYSVRFFDRLDGASFLPDSVHVRGNALFGGPVGEVYDLDSLIVDGWARLSGGLVRTTGDQFYGRNALLGADAVLQSTGGGLIHFAGALDGPFNLRIETGGITRFDRAVGGQMPLGLLTTDAGGLTRPGARIHAGSMDFGDPLWLGSNLALFGSERININAGIIGRGADVRMVSPDTRLQGRLLQIGLFETDAGGTTLLSSPLIQVNEARFLDKAVLGGPTRLTSNGQVAFASTLDGGFDLDVLSSDRVVFGDLVGGDVALRSLRIASGGLIQVDGGAIHVIDNLSLRGGRAFTGPAVATITGLGSDGSLVFRSANGWVSLGRGSRVTALGDLIIEGGVGVTLGDLNALGDIRVTAPVIQIHTRPGSDVLNRDGGITRDSRVDLVAASGIDFSVEPTLLGLGREPVLATTTGEGISANLMGFSARSFGDLDASWFMFGDTVLDLVAPPPAVTPPPPPPPPPPVTGANPATVEPGDLPSPDGGRPSEPLLLNPVVRRNLERLAIYPRELEREEQVSTAQASALIDDAVAVGIIGPVERTPTAVNRLSRRLILQALATYASVFFAEDTPVDVDFAERTDRTAEVRAALASVLQQSGAEDRDIDQLRRLLAALRASGLTRAEYERSRRAVLGPITPEGVSEARMIELVEGPVSTTF